MKISRNLLIAAFVVCSFPVVASETPVPAEVAQTMFQKVSGFVSSSAWTIAHSPVDLVDVLGAARLTAYLSAVEAGVEKGFVANNAKYIARTTVALTAAAAVYALIQAYQALVAEEDMEDGDEYFNVFETEDNDDEVVASDLE